MHINLQGLFQVHNNRTIIYEYITLLPYVSAYSGHLQEDDDQRKKKAVD
jgi:hypothetical protein